MRRRRLQVGDRVRFLRKHVRKGQAPRDEWEVVWEPQTVTVGLGHGRFVHHDEVLLRRLPTKWGLTNGTTRAARKQATARVDRLALVQAVEERLAEELMRG